MSWAELDFGSALSCVTTSYSYDLMDNLVKEVSTLRAKTSYTYDKHDIVTRRTDAKGSAYRQCTTQATAM